MTLKGPFQPKLFCPSVRKKEKENKGHRKVSYTIGPDTEETYN